MQLNQRGVTLQTVILAGVLTLAATGAAIVIYNAIADRSSNIEGVNTDFLEPIGFKPRPIDPVFNPFVPQNPVSDEPQTPVSDEEECVFSTEPVQEAILLKCQSYNLESAGAVHTCAVHTDGTISCWGYGEQGQLGDGNFYSGTARVVENPVIVRGINDAETVSVGSHHTCAVHTDGTISCWGEGFPNVLGNIFQHNFESPHKLIDREGNPRTGFTKVSAGNRFTCALKEDGRIICWGFGEHGQLGDGVINEPITSDPLNRGSRYADEVFKEVSGIDNAIDITTGTNHACALLDDTTIKCWGGAELGLFDGIEYGNLGKLGNNADKTQPAPVSVVDDSNQIASGFTAVSAGEWYTCGIRESNTYCWGFFTGSGSILSTTSKRVTEFEAFQETAVTSLVASSPYSACVARKDDAENDIVWCWGHFGIAEESSPGKFDTLLYRNAFEVPGIVNPISLHGNNRRFCALVESEVESGAEGGVVICFERNSNQEIVTTQLASSVMALSNS